MPAPIRTREDTIGWEQARAGRSRLTQNDWAAGASVDDCALFQSTAVFGQKAAWNVDVFKTLDGGTYHAGKGGLSRGDVVLFDWNGNGVGDHTEMALASPDSAGNFPTIGANGSDTIAVAQRTRNGYVLGYFRPNYVAAPASVTPATPPGKENNVFIINRKGWTGIVVPAENGKLFATVLGQQDANSGFPVVTFEWDTAWAMFKSRLVNPADVPA